MKKKTVVLGASTNPGRYAYLAVMRLLQQGHEVVPVGIREGSVGGLSIQTNRPFIDEVDTITLYLNPSRQKDYYDYILSLRPKRILFNPGTENPELISLAQKEGIETEIACTLVMLASRTY